MYKKENRSPTNSWSKEEVPSSNLIFLESWLIENIVHKGIPRISIDLSLVELASTLSNMERE